MFCKTKNESREFKWMIQPEIGLVASVTRNSQRLVMKTVVFVSPANVRTPFVMTRVWAAGCNG